MYIFAEQATWSNPSVSVAHAYLYVYSAAFGRYGIAEGSSSGYSFKHTDGMYSAEREESRLTTFSLFSPYLCHTRRYDHQVYISKLSS